MATILEKMLTDVGAAFSERDVKKAIDVLQQFPEGPNRQGLEDLVNFVTDRKY